jgi:hypothetical protein
LGLGINAVGWAKEGLIDVLVVTPRWATLEFDMPLERWRETLRTANVTLAGGLEILYRPCPGGPAAPVTPELAKGAAISVLSRGADAVYLFNYFQDSDPHAQWSLPVYKSTLKAMGSLDALLKEPRAVGITYRDITAPGETYTAPLPAQGKDLVFSVRVGPVPNGDWHCELLVDFAPLPDSPFTMPAVAVNGKPCEVRHDEMLKNEHRLISFPVPLKALAEAEAQQIKIVGKDPNSPTAYRVERLEVSFTPSSR